MDSDLTPAALMVLRKILDAADLDNRKTAAATGLTPSQGMVLRQICAHDSTTPGAVAVALRFGQATITNIVDRLVAAGLVTRERSNADKRQILLQATAEGREKLRAFPFPCNCGSARAMRSWSGGSRRCSLPRWNDWMHCSPPDPITQRATPSERLTSSWKSERWTMGTRLPIMCAAGRPTPQVRDSAVQCVVLTCRSAICVSS
ncbi:MarR family winged helix-turn-helix transcriptional regulator [Novosphingobium panipatense]